MITHLDIAKGFQKLPDAEFVSSISIYLPFSKIYRYKDVTFNVGVQTILVYKDKNWRTYLLSEIPYFKKFINKVLKDIEIKS